MFECSEQLLFSCVSSKVIVCHAIYHMSYFTYHMSNVKGQMLILILGTCLVLVFMSMLKSDSLLPKIAMLFFDIITRSCYTLDVIELVPS